MQQDKHHKDQKPAPLETDRGEQQDDNIDDLGRRPDGEVQDQPVQPSPQEGDKPKR